MEGQKSGRKTRVGTVISNKMDKTVVVKVERLVRHPRYHKFIRRQNKFMAHDAHNACQIGDQVLIEEVVPEQIEALGCGENVGKSGHVIGLWRAAEIAGMTWTHAAPKWSNP